MIKMRFNLRFPLITALAVVLFLTACGGDSKPASSPARPASQATASTAPVAAPTPSAPVPQCDPRASLRPQGSLAQPGSMPQGSQMRKIQERGRLIVGVSTDTPPFGEFNSLSGQFQGFDIDVLKEMARAILGDPNAIEFRPITYAQRLPMLESGEVDLVAHTMTINCARWQRISFSTVYYEAGQRVLVRKANPATRIEDLGGQRICSQLGSTSIDNIDAKKSPVDSVRNMNPPIIPVGVTDVTDCLVMFQQGKVDGISTDDVILAGLAAQDPYAKVVGPLFTEEPYGIGVGQNHPEFVRFVNAVLERMRQDGTWTAIYNKWLASTLGPAPAAPPARYRD